MQHLVGIELLLLLSACVLSTEDTHYLQYLHTAFSSQTDGPGFTAVGQLDGEKFMYYNSDINKATPKTEWIKKSEADYWDRETDRQQHDQYILMHNLNAVMQSFNHTEGSHTLQRMYSCELDGDSTTGGHVHYCYDGEGFISLNLSTGTWTTDKPEAKSLMKTWETEGRGADFWKSYIENECISWLKMFVSYGGESLKGKGDKHVVNHRETFTCMVQNSNWKAEYHEEPKGGGSEGGSDGGSKKVWIPIIVVVIALIGIGIVVLVFRKNIISGFRPVSQTSNDMSLS